MGICCQDCFDITKYWLGSFIPACQVWSRLYQKILCHGKLDKCQLYNSCLDNCWQDRWTYGHRIPTNLYGKYGQDPISAYKYMDTRTNVTWTTVVGTFVTWSNAYKDLSMLHDKLGQDTIRHFRDMTSSNKFLLFPNFLFTG